MVLPKEAGRAIGVVSCVDALGEHTRRVGLPGGVFSRHSAFAAAISNSAAWIIQEAGKQLDDGGKICAIVTLLLAGYTGLHSTYEGMKAPVEHFTRAASKESP